MLYLLPDTAQALQSIAYFERCTSIGQLYNLDDNKKINFQFNPEEYELSDLYKWPANESIGAPMVQRQYIGQGPGTFSLQLLFIADIGMPPVTTEGNVDPLITPDDIVVDFDRLHGEVKLWNKVREAEGRPSFIRIFIGKDSLTGVTTELRKHVLDSFGDGSARRGILGIEFQPWSEVIS